MLHLSVCLSVSPGGHGKPKGLAFLTSKRYEHELKVTTSTIQYSQGPWNSTVTVQVQCIIILLNYTN